MIQAVLAIKDTLYLLVLILQFNHFSSARKKDKL